MGLKVKQMQDNCLVDNIKDLGTMLMVYGVVLGTLFGIGLAAQWTAAACATLAATVTLTAIILHTLVYPALAFALVCTTLNNLHALPRVPRLMARGIRWLAVMPLRVTFWLRVPSTEEGLLRAAMVTNGACPQNHRHWVLPWAIRGWKNREIRRRMDALGMPVPQQIQGLMAKPVRAKVLA